MAAPAVQSGPSAAGLVEMAGAAVPVAPVDSCSATVEPGDTVLPREPAATDPTA